MLLQESIAAIRNACRRKRNPQPGRAVRPAPLLLLAGLLLPVAVLFPGAGRDARAAPPPPATNVPATTNTLAFWMDIPTNAARSDLWARSGLARTNYCPHAENLFATSAAWRTTTTIESGFFRARPCDAWEDGHRHERHGWYQGVGMEAEREIIPGSGVSVGLGVSVGRATLH